MQGASGKLFLQIKNGAPFDVFLAADTNYPAKLVKAGFGLKSDLYDYAKGRLVLWAPKADISQHPIQYLQSSHYTHLAIANPDLAPYGLAAKQALTALGLWKALLPKLVIGENIAQTATFVRSGAAKVGIVGLASANDLKNTSQIWVIPSQDYQPILQQALILKQSKQHASAKRFCQFLQTKRIKALIKRMGYDIP